MFSSKIIEHKPIIKIRDIPLDWCEEIEYLGHHLTSNLNEDKDINCKRAQMFGKFNELMNDFYFMNSDVLVKLYKQTCCSFFGGAIYDFESADLSRFNNAFKSCLRRIFDLPRNSHSNIVLNLANCVPVQVTLYNRAMKFLDSDVENELVQFYFKLAKRSFTRTVSGRNFVHLFLLGNIATFENERTLSAEDEISLNVIKDLNEMKGGDIFTKSEIDVLIETMSTL